MKTFLASGSSRREFLGRVIPACAVTCLGLRAMPLLGQAGQAKPAETPAKHKFDTEIPRKLSFRQAFLIEYASDFIPLLKFLAKDMGDAKAVDLLKKFSAERSAEAAAENAKRLGSNDFAALKKLFDPSFPGLGPTLTFTVSESSDKVHTLHVTECLWAKTFLEAKAGELGYAAICSGDYAFAQAFNPKIEMVRTKTLMQGMDCCDHAYLWKS